MPRQKNTRPTNIYWLYDIRPETVAVFGPAGQPFYCGKTVNSPEFRLRQHVRDACAKPHGAIAPALRLCAEYVRVQIIEIVAPDSNWADRERYWIGVIRALNPNCANIAIGGAGSAGMIHSAKNRALFRANAIVQKHTSASRKKRRKATFSFWSKRNPVPKFLEEPDGW